MNNKTLNVLVCITSWELVVVYTQDLCQARAFVASQAEGETRVTGKQVHGRQNLFQIHVLYTLML